MAKELVYQGVDYLGLGRVLPFVDAVNQVLTARGVALPLPSQSTTTPETRLEKGVDAQVTIFGDGMRDAWRQGTINRWLGANCFGDYYTRTGLDPVSYTHLDVYKRQPRRLEIFVSCPQKRGWHPRFGSVL